MVKRKRLNFKPIAIILIIIIGSYVIFNVLHDSPEDQAKETVNEFLQNEQEGDFSDSWKSLHSLIHDRFSQADYIKQRSTFYKETLEVDSFDYNIIDVDHLDQWRMTEQSNFLSDVYKITVKQTVSSTFGEMAIRQNYFVSQDKEGKWKIIWSFK